MALTKQLAFIKKVTDLPDVPSPNYEPSEIKTYFQNPADELAQTHNDLVDELVAPTGAAELGAKDIDNTTGTVQSLLSKNGTGLKTHKESSLLDHPDKSVTTAKIADKAVTREKVASGAIGVNEIDPLIMNQPTTVLGVQAKLEDITGQLAEKANEIETVTKNPNNYSGAIVTIIDDDIQDDVSTVWNPVLSDTGAKITFAVITDRVGTSGYMTLEEIHQLQDNGNEIVSHTSAHIPTYDITPEQAEVEYPKAKQWMIDNGLKGYNTLVYPGGFGAMTQEERVAVKNVARKYYKYGVATIITGQPIDGVFDNWQAPRINGDSDTLAMLKTKLDTAIASGGWMLIMTHSQILGNEGSQKMRDFIIHAQSLGVPIMPFGEAEKYKGNVAAIGEYEDDGTFVNANGSMKTKSKFIVKGWNSGSVMDAPITDYAVDTQTNLQLNSVEDTFLNKGGNYTVFRGSTDLYASYATFMPYNQNVIYMRKWNGTSWNTWDMIGNVSISKTTNNGDILLEPVSYFMPNREYIYSCSTNVNGPNGKAGIYRLYTGAYAYGEYKIYNTNELYRRRWDSTVWTTWEKVSAV